MQILMTSFMPLYVKYFHVLLLFLRVKLGELQYVFLQPNFIMQ